MTTIVTRVIKGVRTSKQQPVQGEEDQDKEKTITGRIRKIISTRKIY